MSTKKPSARKPIYKCLETLDVKHKNAVCMLGAAKAKSKKTKTGNLLWLNISKRGGHTQLNQRSEKTFTIGFYIILRLFNIRLQMVVFMYILMATHF